MSIALASSPASAGNAGTLCVQVVYAEPGRVWSRQVNLPQGSTALSAIQDSGFFREFPNYPADTLRLGIFGRECDEQYVLANRDRIEIYRPLVFDPMESRRRRAAHKKSAMNRPAARKRKKRTGVSPQLSRI